MLVVANARRSFVDRRIRSVASATACDQASRLTCTHHDISGASSATGQISNLKNVCAPLVQTGGFRCAHVGGAARSNAVVR